jgi:hypothetical protein
MGGVMKRTISLLAQVAAVLVFMSAAAFAQEKTQVKVKGSEVVTGVVIVHVEKNGKSIELQCNDGAGRCKALASGNYTMIELPENHGMYECKNVEVYKGNQDTHRKARRWAHIAWLRSS